MRGWRDRYRKKEVIRNRGSELERYRKKNRMIEMTH